MSARRARCVRCGGPMHAPAPGAPHYCDTCAGRYGRVQHQALLRELEAPPSISTRHLVDTAQGAVVLCPVCGRTSCDILFDEGPSGGAPWPWEPAADDA